MDFLTSFLGRFHPLLVHLPIGILLLAFLFECLSFNRRYKSLRKAVQPALLWGTISAVAAAITGFFLRQEGGYDEIIANRHQNAGILTAVLALVVYVLRPKVKYWVDTSQGKKRVKLALSFPLMCCLILTGHWGGSMTHGEDYLFAVAIGNEERDPMDAIRSIPDPEEALLYHDVIRPIFEGRCYDCHSAARQKGDLRLDRIDFIARGGKSGPVIGESADSSDLFNRLMLPIEDDDHMPPREKPQLSSSEIALVKYWIDGGAGTEKTVAEYDNKEKITAIIHRMQQPPAKSWTPAEAVSAAEIETLSALRLLGIVPVPIAENSNYLMISFIGKRVITDEQVQSLGKIRDQLVWLNLSHSGISDEQLKAVGQLQNLRVLYLNNTALSDAGLAYISSLSELRWLSIVGTQVSDAGTPALRQLKNLSNLYMFETRVTRNGILDLTKGHTEISIDTGNYSIDQLTN